MKPEQISDTEVALYRQLLRTRSDIDLLKETFRKSTNYTSRQLAVDNLDVVSEIEKELIDRIRNEFGVVFPSDTLINGETGRPVSFQEGQRIFYLDWLEKIRIKESEDFFKTTICFGCPFSKKDRAQAYGEMCEYEVSEKDMKPFPHDCFAVDEHSQYGITSYARLYERIKLIHGDSVLEEFKAYRDSI